MGGSRQVTLNADEMSQSFRNLSLSLRGSERQAPNNLQLALRFSRAVEVKDANKEHPAEWNLEERLRNVVNDFHVQCQVTAKHQICEDKLKGILNIISGTSIGARDIISQHLNHHKWHQSAFSTEQFRSTRWVLGVAPKMSQCPMRKALTVTEESQQLHLRLVVQHYVESGRRLRPSARSRMRLTQDQWDRFCDFACIYAAVLAEARQLTTFNQEKENEIVKRFFQRCFGSKLVQILFHIFLVNF